MKTTLLTGKLQIKTVPPVLGKPIGVQMTISNKSDQAVEIINQNVGIPPPELHWTASTNAYKIALLISVGVVTIILKNDQGKLIASKGLTPWVTPILSRKTLLPQQKMEFEFDLDELFFFESSGSYFLWLRYGDDTYVESMVDFDIIDDVGQNQELP
jgi:hypothetical protein